MSDTRVKETARKIGTLLQDLQDRTGMPVSDISLKYSMDGEEMKKQVFIRIDNRAIGMDIE